jgi:hypothetical protein
VSDSGPPAKIGKTFTGTPKVSHSSKYRWRHWRRYW